MSIQETFKNFNSLRPIFLSYLRKTAGGGVSNCPPPPPAGPINEKEKVEDHISVEY